MIIKKPYAFLIKKFRLIHLLLSIGMIYLIIKSHNLFYFFSKYVSEGTFTSFDNLNSMYLGSFVFISLVIVLLFVFIIYLLMRWKNKNRKLYIFSFIFYLILFIAFLVYFNILGGLSNKVLDERVLRAYRDFSLILYLPQYIFTLMVIIRATGFNIEKFNFKGDLEKLDIAEEDQEEIEVTISNDTYKIPRFFRKQYHEFIYYYKENRIFVFLSLFIIVSIVIFLTYRSIYNRVPTYYENKIISIDGVNFSVNNSYISNLDYKGNVLDKNKNYVIVSITLENISNSKKVIDSDLLVINAGEKYYYPIYSLSDYFIDFGEVYYKNVIYALEKNDYLIVYELPENIDYNSLKLRINNNSYNTISEVKLNPKVYFKEEDIYDYLVKDAISFENSSLKNSSFLVNNYSISDSFVEEFRYCVNECYNGKKIIKPDLLTEGDMSIIKLETDLSLDKNLSINKYIKSSSDFISYFTNISYVINDNEKYVNSKVFKLDNIKTNNVYLMVPKEIKYADSIYLNIVIRNKKYVIKMSK